MAWGGQPVFPKAGGERTGPLPLHPMTVGDILDGAFRLMKADLRSLLPVVAVFVVPLQLVAAFAQRNVLGGAGIFDAMSDPSLASEGSFATDADAIVGVVAGLLNLLVLPFLAGAVSQIVSASYLGRRLGAGEALRATWSRFWALFGGWVVVHVLELVGLVVAGVVFVGLALSGSVVAGAAIGVLLALLVGLPVLLAAMALSVATAPAIMVERLGPVAGVRRSWSLVRRRFFPVLGIALLAGLVATVLGQILGFVPTVLGLVIGLEGGWVLLAVGAIVTALITEPIVAIVATLLYFDLRIRFEGFDLEVMAAELASSTDSR